MKEQWTQVAFKGSLDGFQATQLYRTQSVYEIVLSMFQTVKKWT
jgi:hypothetical protein